MRNHLVVNIAQMYFTCIKVITYAMLSKLWIFLKTACH